MDLRRFERMIESMDETFLVVGPICNSVKTTTVAVRGRKQALSRAAGLVGGRFDSAGRKKAVALLECTDSTGYRDLFGGPLGSAYITRLTVE